MDILRRMGTEPTSAPAQLQHTSSFPQQNSFYAARTRDPNAPENKYQVNQKCIYERQLPGGSYITAHLQRLQSGYYDTPVIHEDLIDNVRFIGINFVFHPSRTTFRFKSAEIRIALHNIFTGDSNPLKNAANVLKGQVPDDRRHSHATQTSQEHVNGSVVRYGNQPTPKKPTRPKFLRHAPHLLYGAVSPETLDWNFNVAGSVGISQGPASAQVNPSGGLKGSYKLYEMMKIQGSVRTLRSWYGHEYDIEDGEIVWTLEENRLQKSGLPREFTFVMLLTKGSSNVDLGENLGDLTLEVQVTPKVSGFLGQGTFPGFVTNLHRFQPYAYPPVDLDQEIGQIFEPSEKGRGFNFARLSSQFDDYVFLPGTTHSKSDAFTTQAGATSSNQSHVQSPQAIQASPNKQQQSPQQANGQKAIASSDGNTLNLRVFLENGRASPAPIAAPLSYLHLRPPSRNPSPLQAASVTGSQRSHKRTITITSQKPSQLQSRNASDSSGAGRPRSQYDAQAPSHHKRSQRRQQSLRKTRSRSELNSEYNSSPVQEKGRLSNQWESSPIPEHRELVHDAVTSGQNTSPTQVVPDTPVAFQAAVDDDKPLIGQPDSQTLPQHEFAHINQQAEPQAASKGDSNEEGPILKPSQPQSGTEGPTEWRTPPESKAELQPSPHLREQRSRIRSRPTSDVYDDQPENLRTTEWGEEGDTIDSNGQQPHDYHDQGSQADPTAEDASHGQDHRLSYSPVRAALDLALAEHGAGLAPGATASSGFGGTGITRKPVPAPVWANCSAPPLSNTATVTSAPLTLLPQAPSTPPLNPLQPHDRREISTSPGMGEATGVWNDTPPDWSPANNKPQTASVGRSYSQRIAHPYKHAASQSSSGASNSPAGSVGKKTRTIRYSYPAVEQADRYYRQRKGQAQGNLKYGDENRNAEDVDGTF